MELYDPLNVLKRVDDGIWQVDGPVVKMSLGFGLSAPFPTRMIVVELPKAELFIWSPTQLFPALKLQIDALGEVAHLISPNKLHYTHIAAWKAAYPAARAWAAPGTRQRADARGIPAPFDADLGDEPDPAWSETLDQLLFRGSRFMEEVVFFHRASRSVILADLIENFEPRKLGAAARLLVRAAGAAAPDGMAPIDLRMTFFGRHRAARACLERMLAWAPERVLIAHGRSYDGDGAYELGRAFRWLRP